MRSISVCDEDMTPEEAKEFEEGYYKYYKNLIKAKDPLDYTFDEEFDTAIECMYYESVSSYGVFGMIEFHFNSLYRHFQYTKRFAAAYEKIANDHYDKNFKEAYGTELADVAFEAAPRDELTNLTCQSTLLMVYSVFEGFLRDVVKYVVKHARNNKDILKYPYNDFTAAKYINYLNKQNVFIPKALYREFNEVRLVRNYYAHSLEEPQKNLLQYLKNDPYGILKGSYITVNPDYIEHVFELLGKMVDSIEETFIENYGRG